MRIAIDASRTTVARQTGTEHYATALIQALLRINSAHDITLYFREPPAPDLFPDSPWLTVRVIAQRRLWTHTRFAAALLKDKPDVVFVPAHVLPIIRRGRSVVTVHDLGYRHFPDAHPLVSRLYLDWMTHFSARAADIVLVDSQATGDDLNRHYGIDRDKMRVVYPGVDPLPIGDVNTMRRKYHLPERYWLFIGTLQPRKNIDRLVKAYVRWRDRHPGDDTALVLAGGKGWLYDERWTAGVDGVIMPGYVDEADKGALYAGALGLVFPSLYEGFGFPMIEAFHCRTPVIASQTSSLRELANDAALLVDPLSIDSIADAMGQISNNPHLCEELRQKSAERARQFTWDAAARQTLAALEAAFKEPHA